MPSTAKLEKLIASDNIAKDLKTEELNKIGQDVVRDFNIDWDSCSDWRTQNELGMKLAKQVAEKKDFPWEGAANIKYPLLTTAAMQFAARAYPEMIQGKDVVKGKVIGADPDNTKQQRADRISRHMSYQVTDEMEEWEEEQDRLFHAIPIVGCLLKKSCYDSIKQRNISYVLWPNEFAINYKAKSLETARRVTHILPKYKNDIRELEEDGIWLSYDYGDAESEQGDTDAPHEFLEQHRWLDLDDDGYSEPYIVTVHKKLQRVTRIVARYDAGGVEINRTGNKVVRIKPHHYFTKYGFIPNPDGGFLDIGFGVLLTPINEALNTAINELLDAGAMHNAGGGFIATGIRIKGGQMKFKLGEWKTIPTLAADLKNGIVPLPVREPSNVLFQLLGLLINAGKDISSVQDVLMGQKPGENVSSETVLALIEQGMKVFSAIYKRIYRSLTAEFKKLYWLNSRYVDPLAYANILNEQVDALKDYNMADVDVRPVADPNLTLDIQRLTKARALMETMGKDPSQNVPEMLRRYYDALKMPDIDKLFITQVPPNPTVEKVYLEMGIMRDKHTIEKQKMLAEIGKLYTEQILNIAKAEATEAGPQLEQYKTQVQGLGMWLKAQSEQQKMQQGGSNAEQGGATGMEAQSGNSGSPGAIG